MPLLESAKFMFGMMSISQLSISIGQHDFNNFCNLSRLILEKGGFTPVFANHKNGFFLLKRAFLGKRQQPVGRRLSNQISSLRFQAFIFFLFTYVQLTFMLHYRIHSFLLRELSVQKARSSELQF